MEDLVQNGQLHNPDYGSDLQFTEPLQIPHRLDNQVHGQQRHNTGNGNNIKYDIE